jgi:hypothetical protein
MLITENDTSTNYSSKSFLASKLVVPAKKGAFSSKKILPTNLSKTTLQKLNSSTKSKSPKKQTYIQSRVDKYCKTKDFSVLDKPLVSHTEWAFIPMKVLSYTDPTDLDQAPKYHTVLPNDANNDNWKIYKEYNNYNKDFLNEESIVNDLNLDTEWLTNQANYIGKLANYDCYTLKGYTHVGDVLVNSFLRGMLDYTKARAINKNFFRSDEYFPVYFQLDKIVSNLVNSKNKLALYSLFSYPESTKVKLYTKVTNKDIPSAAPLQKYIECILEKYRTFKHSEKYVLLLSLWNYLHNDVYNLCIDTFCKDISRLFKNSPPLTKDCTVYRGVRNDFYLRGAKNGFYKNIGFVSTSFDIEQAQFFQRLGNEDTPSDCCIQKITLTKGTKVLLMMSISQYGAEKEILLNHGSTYTIVTPKVLKSFYDKSFEKSSDICKKNIYKVNVSEIILTS